MVALAFAALTVSYVRSDFSVANVWENSHSLKPLIYKITGVWGNHEGSMLLWVLILTFFGSLVAMFGANLPPALRANVLAVQGWIGAAFLLFILVTSNPFARLSPAPIEGQDLNPVLQDIGLAIHPPLLYLGYVGFSVCFSFAVAALIDGRIDASWARWVRPWTLAAWVFLTAASRWAPTGPITNSAGAASGSGIRSRTRPSCPGLRARRCCIPRSSWKNARR
jgi:cytochrome c-type biogenesis protein CcmF